VILDEAEPSATIIRCVHIGTSQSTPSALERIATGTASLVRARWFGYVFGLLFVVAWTLVLMVLLPNRLANQSALYAIPVLLTAAGYGRGPALVASLAAFAGFDWLFADPPPLDPGHMPTLLVLLVIALVAGQLGTTLRKQAEDARQREREALALYDMARLVPGSTLELGPLLGSIVDQMKAIVDYDATFIVLHDTSRPECVVEYRGPLPR
jgi:K+-sensing histidine kinase KdpD